MLPRTNHVLHWTGSIVINFTAVDTSMVGSYQVTYDVSDLSGNSSHEERTVLVVALVPPAFDVTCVGNPSEDARITFQSILGLDYTIYTATDLENFTTLTPTVITGDGTEISFDHTGGMGDQGRFYVLGVEKSGS